MTAKACPRGTKKVGGRCVPNKRTIIKLYDSIDMEELTMGYTDVSEKRFESLIKQYSRLPETIEDGTNITDFRAFLKKKKIKFDTIAAEVELPF